MSAFQPRFTITNSIQNWRLPSRKQQESAHEHLFFRFSGGRDRAVSYERLQINCK